MEVADPVSEEEDSKLREVPLSEIPDNELTDDDAAIADENGDGLLKALKSMWDAFSVAKTAQLLEASSCARNTRA